MAITALTCLIYELQPVLAAPVRSKRPALPEPAAGSALLLKRTVRRPATTPPLVEDCRRAGVTASEGYPLECLLRSRVVILRVHCHARRDEIRAHSFGERSIEIRERVRNDRALLVVADRLRSS